MITAILLMALVVLLIVPMPEILIDFMIGLNMSLATVLLMTAIYIRSPIQFITFPSVILMGTAFRIALSVATTRLILSEASGGKIIETFGKVVVAGSVLVGLVIFMIIAIVQFIVVTKGAERVAEVAARFALDSMPGKQLSIDADIKAKAITQEEGNARRSMLDKQSQYLGAMDGAMKFVKGDAIAGIIIVVVNLVGGFAIGTLVHSMQPSEAIRVYSLLTIGDGLVAQIPSLMMAVSAGIVITRVTNVDGNDLGGDILTELTSDTRIFMMASPFVILAGFIPGFPTVIFLGLGAGMFAFSYFKWKHEKEIHAIETKKEETKEEKIKTTDRFILSLHGIDEGDEIFLNAINKRSELHEAFTAKIGLNLPAFEIQAVPGGKHAAELIYDDVRIFNEDCEQLYTKKLHFKGNYKDIKLLGADEDYFEEADFAQDEGYWIDVSNIKNAGLSESDLITPEIAFVLSAFEHYEKNVEALITRNEVINHLSGCEEKYKGSVTLLRETLGMSKQLELFKTLIRGSVPFTPKALFFTSLDEILEETQSVPDIVSFLRKRMCRQITTNYLDSENVLPALTLKADTERALVSKISGEDTDENWIKTKIKSLKGVIDDLNGLNSKTVNGKVPCIIVDPTIREKISMVVMKHDLPFPVLATDEIPPELNVHPLQTIG